jgi:hypothetical protein
MRVVLPEGVDGPLHAERLKWRGMTLDHFDGAKWTRKLGGHLASSRPLRENQALVHRPHDIPDVNRLKRFEFHLNPTGTNTLFTPQGTAMLDLSQSGDYTASRNPVDETWTLNRVILDVPIYYEALADISRGSLRDRGIPEISPTMETGYLALPDGQERVKELAEQWTQGAADPDSIAEAITSHLDREYVYSLTAREEEGSMTLSEFLFRKKAGHCEYFATALAVMLRTRGVPARLVAGYLPGEWNSSQHYFLVRQSDAHAWVEAFDPEKGWIVFDPSPEPLGGMRIPSGLWAKLLQFADAFNLLWDQNVISFENSDQVRILQRAVRALRRLWNAVERMISGRPVLPEESVTAARETAVNMAGIARWLVAAGLFAIVLYRVLSRREKRHRIIKRKASPLSRNSLQAVREFLRLIEYCEKRTRNKEEGETYLEFSKEVEESRPRIFAGLTEAAFLYYGIRFSQVRIRVPETQVPGTFARSRDRLREISQEIRSRKG